MNVGKFGEFGKVQRVYKTGNYYFVIGGMFQKKEREIKKRSMADYALEKIFYFRKCNYNGKSKRRKN